MNYPEAVQLYAAMTLLDPYAKKRTEEEVETICRQIAGVLPFTPLSWAMEHVRKAMTSGKILTVPELAASWTVEAKRRIDAVPVPPAPAEIEDDPEKWQAWERARRAALVMGASAARAQEAASKQLGVSPATGQIAARRTADMEGLLHHGPASGAPIGESAKNRVLAQIAQWQARQAREQDELTSENEGGAA